MEKKNEENIERETEVVVVMDTPERSRLSNPLSKFEDSPVFNYICNLSPLETIKPTAISQTFNSYSFSSVPSVFTSPHLSSLKDSKLLRRHSFPVPSNQGSSSENGNKIDCDGGFVDVSHNSEGQKEKSNPGGCLDDKGNLENGVSQVENYDCHRPGDSMVACHGIVSKCVSAKLHGSSSALVHSGEEGSTSGFVNNGEHNRGDGNFDWVNISDVADYLVFGTPDNADPFKGSFLKPLDSEMILPVPEKTQADVLVGVEANGTENTLIRTEDQSNATEATGNVLAFTSHNHETSLNNHVTEESDKVIGNESTCNLARGVRRRCLVFDIGGNRRKFLDDGSSSSSSMLLKSHTTSNENQPIPSKPDHNSSQCIVPGIGLHLNALARTSKVYTINNHETLATQRQLLNDVSSNSAPNSFASNQETMNSAERFVSHVNGDFHGIEDAYQLSGYLGDDLNQGSPKKIKRKLENGGENESCKRCNCKKSKCLKLYCECFAAGVYCVEPCSCQDCFNKPIHEDTVLATRKQIESRNPLAFAPKVIRTNDPIPETVDDLSSTPASARHKRGCNCKKSGCLKKYCECYQGGVGCSMNCRCEGCKNVFGRKCGTHIVLAEAEVEEKETQAISVVDHNSSKYIIQNNTDKTPSSFLSKNKPPRSFLSACSSSTLYGGQKGGIPAILQSQQEFEKQALINSENQVPEILRSPTSGIKSSSPNSKRVSPPHCNFESSLSPARTSSRKLILHSIPSFPSLKD